MKICVKYRFWKELYSSVFDAVTDVVIGFLAFFSSGPV